MLLWRWRAAGKLKLELRRKGCRVRRRSVRVRSADAIFVLDGFFEVIEWLMKGRRVVGDSGS